MNCVGTHHFGLPLRYPTFVGLVLGCSGQQRANYKPTPCGGSISIIVGLEERTDDPFAKQEFTLLKYVPGWGAGGWVEELARGVSGLQTSSR